MIPDIENSVELHKKINSKLVMPGTGFYLQLPQQNFQKQQKIQQIVQQSQQIYCQNLYTIIKESFKVENYVQELKIINEISLDTLIVRLTVSDDSNLLTCRDIIITLQSRGFAILLSYQTSSQVLQSIQKYQDALSRLNSAILGSLCLEISLPIDTNPVLCLGVFRRTIPLSIASLVIRDWGHTKTIFKLHFIKGMPCLWNLQFITTKIENISFLSHQCLGIQ